MFLVYLLFFIFPLLEAPPGTFRVIPAFPVPDRAGVPPARSCKVLFRHFLQEFVHNSEEEWCNWEKCFGESLENHGPKQFSIDMIKQLLMRTITKACAARFITVSMGRYCVQDRHRAELADMLTSKTSLAAVFQALNVDGEAGGAAAAE